MIRPGFTLPILHLLDNGVKSYPITPFQSHATPTHSHYHLQQVSVHVILSAMPPATALRY